MKKLLLKIIVITQLIIFFPYLTESIKENTKAKADLNDKYLNKLAPGI